VLVFSVTRVIFIPIGEFVSYGALTLAAIEAGKYPSTATLLVFLGGCTFAADIYGIARSSGERAAREITVSFVKFVLLPVALLVLARTLPLGSLPMFVQVVLSMAIVIPMGPMMYRLAFQPLAEASVLVLLIVAVAVHFAMVGMGLIIFGAEGSRTATFTDARFDIGALSISGQSLVIIGTSVVTMVALYFYFGRTLPGRALRATAVNRLGARLVGIGTTQAGRLAFTLAPALGTLCGVLVAPLTTVYYDSGFLIGLKGFVSAIIGGLGSYPIAAVGALLVGLLESYSSFWASAFKEVIVFTLIIPVLLWRSLVNPHADEGEE